MEWFLRGNQPHTNEMIWVVIILIHWECREVIKFQMQIYWSAIDTWLRGFYVENKLLLDPSLAHPAVVVCIQVLVLKLVVLLHFTTLHNFLFNLNTILPIGWVFQKALRIHIEHIVSFHVEPVNVPISA